MDQNLNNFSTELITIEEFAKRIGVSRNTVFGWKKSGQLKAGRHYIQIGRTIRFEWGEQLINRLYEDSIQNTYKVYSSKTARRCKTKNIRRRSNSIAVINLDY